MTDTETADAQALPLLLRAAQTEVANLRQLIIRDLSVGEAEADPVTTAQVLSNIRDYSAAVLNVTSLEAQIEKHSNALCGVVQVDAVNLEDARREVIDRIARFRERSGD